MSPASRTGISLEKNKVGFTSKNDELGNKKITENNSSSPDIKIVQVLKYFVNCAAENQFAQCKVSSMFSI